MTELEEDGQHKSKGEGGSKGAADWIRRQKGKQQGVGIIIGSLVVVPINIELYSSPFVYSVPI